MTQHVIRSTSENLAWLEKTYGVPWSQIAVDTFGTSSPNVFYPWLRDNGGKRLGSDPNFATGYHWTWNSGMVVDVPGNAPSVSSVEQYMMDNLRPPVPGGPNVVVNGVQGEPAGPAEPAPGGKKPKEPDPQGPPPVNQAAISGGGDGMMTWLIVGAAVYFLFGDELFGKKKKKGERRKKRRGTTKRRRRRRR